MKATFLLVCILAAVRLNEGASHYRYVRSPQSSGSSASASAQSQSGGGFGRQGGLSSSSANAETSSISGGFGGSGSSSASANANSGAYNTAGLLPRQQVAREYGGRPASLGFNGRAEGYRGGPAKFGRAPIGYTSPLATGSLANANANAQTVG